MPFDQSEFDRLEQIGYTDESGNKHYLDPRRYSSHRKSKDSDSTTSEKRGEILDELRKLPDYQLLLAVFDGRLTFADIAFLLNVHRSTPKRRCARWIDDVRRRFTQRDTDGREPDPTPSNEE